MVCKQNTKNRKIIKDIYKRILFIVFTISVVLNGASLVVDLYNSRQQKSLVSTNKDVQVITKEFEKTTGKNVVEKTKEVQKTEKDNQPNGLIETYNAFLNDKGSTGIWTRHLTIFAVELIFYCLFTIVIKGVGDLQLFGFGIKSAENTKVEYEQKIEYQRTKMDILKYWILPGNQTLFSRSVTDKTLIGFLSEMMEKAQTTFSQEFNSNFDFEILSLDEFEKSKHPKAVKKSANALTQYEGAISIHKEENLPYKKNYLIYKTQGLSNEGKKEYMVVLYSYRYSFNEEDEKLIASLASLATTLHKEYAYSVVMLEQHKEIEELKKKIK